MIGNDHVRFGRGPSGKGPAQLAPRLTAYLALKGGGDDGGTTEV
jgi:hypothetical protein